MKHPTCLIDKSPSSGRRQYRRIFKIISLHQFWMHNVKNI